MKNYTPKKAIKLYCLQNNNYQRSFDNTGSFVKDLAERKGKIRQVEIRRKCVKCSNNSYKEADECKINYCALYPFRKGKKPTKAELKEFAENLAKDEIKYSPAKHRFQNVSI